MEIIRRIKNIFNVLIVRSIFIIYIYYGNKGNYIHQTMPHLRSGATSFADTHHSPFMQVSLREMEISIWRASNSFVMLVHYSQNGLQVGKRHYPYVYHIMWHCSWTSLLRMCTTNRVMSDHVCR